MRIITKPLIVIAAGLALAVIVAWGPNNPSGDISPAEHPFGGDIYQLQGNTLICDGSDSSDSGFVCTDDDKIIQQLNGATFSTSTPGYFTLADDASLGWDGAGDGRISWNTAGAYLEVHGVVAGSHLGVYTSAVYLNSTSYLLSQSSLRLTEGGAFKFYGRSQILSAADGDLTIAVAAGTSGYRLDGGTGGVTIRNFAGDADGYAQVSDIKVTGTTSWGVQAGADTACTTTCSGHGAALFGFDSGTGLPVGAADATADSCVCGNN